MRRSRMMPSSRLILVLLLLLGHLQAVGSTFDLLWSGRWDVHGHPKGWNPALPCCRGLTGFNLTAFPVLQQGRIALFFNGLGLFRHSYAPAGLPQTVDLEAHAKKVAVDVAAVVPAGKDMHCCIDWETYAPLLFDHGEGSYSPAFCPEARYHGGHGCGCLGTPGNRYSMPGCGGCPMAVAALNGSMQLVLQRQPQLNQTTAAALAVAEFNAAARALWTRTIVAAKQARPRCRWGFYGKPFGLLTDSSLYPPFVTPYTRAVSDAYQWMVNESTALYPSTYMHFRHTTANSYNNSRYVRDIMREAKRLGAKRGNRGGSRINIMPWVWYRYEGQTSPDSLLLRADMHTALAVPSAAGADGLMLYEDGGAQPGMSTFGMTQAYMETVLGPIATALYGGAS
jgi:hypothetical protein